MKKNSSVIYIGTIILIFTVFIWASGGICAEPKAAGVKGADAKPTPQSAPPTQPVPETPPYKYNPSGKPDPFKPFVEQELAVKKKKEAAKSLPLSPLQRANIDQFKLAGISGDENGRRAIVQDVRGKVYPISKGTYIGTNNGRVVAILVDRIIIEERVKEIDGKKTKLNRITVQLRREEGEEKP